MIGTGPIIELFVSIPLKLRQVFLAQKKPVPAPFKVAALVDTGASGTVITAAVVRALGLAPVGTTQMSTVSTQQPVTVSTYNVDLLFPNTVTINDCNASEGVLGGQQIQCLIGRDVLQHGVLVYIGYMRQFTISF
jgi:hypothetical protein